MSAIIQGRADSLAEARGGALRRDLAALFRSGARQGWHGRIGSRDSPMPPHPDGWRREPDREAKDDAP